MWPPNQKKKRVKQPHSLNNNIIVSNRLKKTAMTTKVGVHDGQDLLVPSLSPHFKVAHLIILPFQHAPGQYWVPALSEKNERWAEFIALDLLLCTPNTESKLEDNLSLQKLTALLIPIQNKWYKLCLLCVQETPSEAVLEGIF